MKTVLIVEDEKILREAYATILAQEGFRVMEAANGQAALDQLRLRTPDLILLDLLMPTMDGYSFLQKADVMHHHPNTKVLAFSNLSDHHKLESMLKMGAVRHVLKSSLSPRQLVETIRSLLDA